jgi:hypothetical protein
MGSVRVSLGDHFRADVTVQNLKVRGRIYNTEQSQKDI